MTHFIAFVALALSIDTAHAEIPPRPDELSKAYEAALTELRAGEDRQSIADRLKPVVEKYSASNYARIARPFLIDLIASAKIPPATSDDPLEKRLADSRVPFQLVKNAGNWDRSLQAFVEKEVTDSVAQLVVADRKVISRLVPLLADRSPVRCDDLSEAFDLKRMTSQPRVCDVALALIEYHAKARFHHDTIQGTYLHQLPDAEREEVAERVTAWWADVKEKSVVAGVRAQLVHGRSYPETVWMATTLARLAEGQETDDREFALNVLREMVKEHRHNHVGAYAANELAELGDTSAVDIFYDEWKLWLGRGGLIHDPQIAFYLCAHGGRREWELLHAISLAELRDARGPAAGDVWAHAVSSREAGTNPYAIPILGLALDRTGYVGSHRIQDNSLEYSSADTACEKFQKQVGKDFEHRNDGLASDRLAAIKKAQAWWDDEGKAKYCFDYIEKEMVPANSASSRPNR